MKKSYLLIVLFFAALTTNAQEEKEELKTDTIKVANISAQAFLANDYTNYGLQLESGCKSLTEIYKTRVLSFSYGDIEYSEGIKGNGFNIRSGSRAYMQSLLPGLFFTYNFAYGRYTFDTDVAGENFEGKYEYISPFSPEFGYKVQVWKITAEAFVGTTWRIEIVGARDVDNRQMQNWGNYFGFRLGYQLK